jgi:3'-phosphoadenosine 5'-phosphosulfate sulfotransferase (PAPS reductase)/FAD synthetase
VTAQLRLLPSDPAPDLADYDLVLVSSSGGKDSQATLDVVVEHADRAGVRDRLAVFHAELGRVEWDGVRDLAAEHAAHYGLRFIAIARPQGDLLDQVRKRGMWPDAARRYCTSDHKRAQGRKAMTRLVRELGLDRPAKVLHCLGFRAEESPARRKMPTLSYDAPASGKGRVRQVWEWLPIHDWALADVWARIRQAGTRHHWAYDAGMPRLSCSFCVLASRSALVRAAQLRPELAAEYVEIERDIGHRFRADMSIAEIVAQAEREHVTTVEGWTA